MLSYRHSFHAGNHADVVKHIVQLLILQSLKQKDKGFLYLDTHSGVGRYSLLSAESEKTGEYLEGVARLWERTDLPEEVALYINELKKINKGEKLRYYAGSPLLAVNQLRPQDRAILTELHPNDFPLLRQEFAKKDNVVTKRENGFQQLKSALPPKERRGFVLIDPPYELKEDYELVVKAIEEAINVLPRVFMRFGIRWYYASTLNVLYAVWRIAVFVKFYKLNWRYVRIPINVV
ncbi:hypothetical protein AP1022_00314 [Actinobacillus pleuropneumoniae]|nr:hypothetical protein AP1022_00314 [Actinobacillus pleuropneumoniae]KIE99630.1 hypothetical protein AP780_00454 [Actinobacillus pleuropneumoniae]